MHILINPYRRIQYCQYVWIIHNLDKEPFFCRYSQDMTFFRLLDTCSILVCRFLDTCSIFVCRFLDIYDNSNNRPYCNPDKDRVRYSKRPYCHSSRLRYNDGKEPRYRGRLFLYRCRHIPDTFRYLRKIGKGQGRNRYRYTCRKDSEDYLFEEVLGFTNDTNFVDLEISAEEMAKLPIGKLLLEIELTTKEGFVQTHQYDLEVNKDGIYDRN